MEEWVPEIRVLGTRSTMEKWVERKSNKDFLYVFAMFVDFSKWSALKVLQNFEK